MTKHRNSLTAAYLRVSSRNQNAASQRSAIERMASARGYEVHTWYSEKRSGKTLARPELDRLRRDVRAGKITRVLIYRLDRLARSGIRDTFEVVEELRHHGCEIHTVADGFDLDGPAAQVVLAVLAWASQMERLAINERIADARERVESEGGSWGRPRRMDDSLIEKAAALRLAGRTIREIAVALKVPRSTVARSLKLSQKLPSLEVA